MATSFPTIVLVHGAWHTPANYKGYVSALEAQGFKVLCPQLPSCNDKFPPVSSFTEDFTAVRNVGTSLVEADERVFMTMHSYGGAVGTDAIEGLIFADRKAEGKSGGNFDDGSTSPSNPSLLFLRGVEQDIVDKELPNLVRSSMPAFETKTKGDAWRRVPVTYILTQQDYSVPRPYQDLMLEKVKSEGVVLKTEDYETFYSVFITKEKEIVDAVVVAAGDERNLG
ncbi:hypothetical protein ACHAPF_000179 [Botrytis cinerea]